VQHALLQHRTFWRSGGTPLSVNSWLLNTSGGAEVSTSMSLYSSFPHLTFTLMVGAMAAACMRGLGSERRRVRNNSFLKLQQQAWQPTHQQEVDDGASP
jgi:hypothetical protein